MLTSEKIKDWSDKRLEQLRADLERITSTEDQTAAARGAIAEHKKLQAAIKNDPPPVWTAPAE